MEGEVKRGIEGGREGEGRGNIFVEQTSLNE